ncbi:hypothetical protein ACFSCZ_00090 [Siminovitchia sediminis]|uniref:Uncharacterized protein n=1 Tax=Siminovitchia sediminis TaxID=1274353 RepID=A0ABW4KFL0_9BACI
MSNPKITANDYNTQMTLPPEVKEEAAVSQVRLLPSLSLIITARALPSWMWRE